jgi:hypothetical protein
VLGDWYTNDIPPGVTCGECGAEYDSTRKRENPAAKVARANVPAAQTQIQPAAILPPTPTGAERAIKFAKAYLDPIACEKRADASQGFVRMIVDGMAMPSFYDSMKASGLERGSVLMRMPDGKGGTKDVATEDMFAQSLTVCVASLVPGGGLMKHPTVGSAMFCVVAIILLRSAARAKQLPTAANPLIQDMTNGSAG